MKKTLNGLALGVAGLVTVAPQMGIIALIKGATGITIPKWVAVVILGLDAAASVVVCLATFGVAVPAAVAKAAAAATSVTA